jgi:hypothetical protein
MFSFGGPTKTYDVMVDNLSVVEQSALLSSDASRLSSLVVYPNPASDVINVSSSSSIDSVSLVNALGQTVAASFDSTSINVATLPKGIYILTVTAGESSTSQKMIVE